MPTRADLLIENAQVLTCDPQRPHAEALAVRGNTIVFIGANQQASEWRQPGVRVIDAGGATLMPGFIDCHTNLRIAAAELENQPLHEAPLLPLLPRWSHAVAGAGGALADRLHSSVYQEIKSRTRIIYTAGTCIARRKNSSKTSSADHGY